MRTIEMSEEINRHRRRFFGAAAMTVAAAQLGIIGFAKAQAGKTTPTQLPTIKPGTNTSFTSLQQIDAGVLNVGYAEAGPVNGAAVILLHGWPYDIHSYVDVASLGQLMKWLRPLLRRDIWHQHREQARRPSADRRPRSQRKKTSSAAHATLVSGSSPRLTSILPPLTSTSTSTYLHATSISYPILFIRKWKYGSRVEVQTGNGQNRLRGEPSGVQHLNRVPREGFFRRKSKPTSIPPLALMMDPKPHNSFNFSEQSSGLAIR